MTKSETKELNHILCLISSSEVLAMSPMLKTIRARSYRWTLRHDVASFMVGALLAVVIVCNL